MKNSSFMRGVCIVAVSAGAFGAAAMADTIYSNDFEVDNNDWTHYPSGNVVPRVASGAGSLNAPSATGGFHAEVGVGGLTRFGGYNFGLGASTSFQEYRTSLSIYLDMDNGSANDSRFAYSSAINDSSGAHRRDFVFSGGYYTDGGNNRFVFSASNNAPGWPGDPGRDPVAIDETGWYTFNHHFYNDGGVLAVDMTLLDSSGDLINSWTLRDSSDEISLIGGNRYGWFTDQRFDFDALAIDNASLTVIPLPPAAWAGLSPLAGVGLVGFIRRRRLQA